MRRTALGVILAAAVGCGDSGPGPSEYPSVAGRYVGVITPDNVADDVPFPASTQVNVRQSGRSVTMSGQFANSEDFEVSGTVNASGVFTGTTGGVAAAMSRSLLGFCGEATTTRLEVRFAGLAAAWDETAGTADCGTVRYTGTLER